MSKKLIEALEANTKSNEQLRESNRDLAESINDMLVTFEAIPSDFDESDAEEVTQFGFPAPGDGDN